VAPAINGHRRRVLVVDDNETARLILRDLLTDFNLDVHPVDSGEGALADLRRAAEHGEPPYNLVLMDWQMPGMDGVEAVRRILDEMLRDRYDIAVALNGEAVLKRAVATPPDLILLDIEMPDMDGYEVVRRLSENEATQGIPVIFVTSRDDEEDERRGLEREWSRAQRTSGEIALLLMDIDHFKAYNDNYGHTAGDECLKQIARVLAGCSRRPGDLVARYGGEEFASIQARVRTHLRMQRIHAQLGEKTAALEQVLAQRDQVERIKRHDLKRPLSRILGHIDALDAEVLPPPVAEVTRRIEREVFGLMETINRTLYLWRLEQGVYVVDPKPIDLIPLLRRVVRSCTDETTAAVSLLINGRPVDDADSFMVPGEELLCHSLMANLLQNALEASPIEEPVRVSLLFDAGHRRVTIRNHGVIPAEIRGHFLQDGVVSHKPGGSGLGGYAARVIADALGASIAFETSETTGTSVFVDWPEPVAGNALPANARRDSLETIT